MEKVYDCETNIKRRALNLVLGTIECFPESICSNKLLNLFTDQLFSTNEEVVKVVSFNFGRCF